MVGVAQLVERRTVAPNVAGSNPVSHPTLKTARPGNSLASFDRPVVFITKRKSMSFVIKLVWRNAGKCTYVGAVPGARYKPKQPAMIHHVVTPTALQELS